MAVLADKAKNLNKKACLEDCTAVCGELSAIGGGFLMSENKGTMRSTDRQTDRQTIVAQTK